MFGTGWSFQPNLMFVGGFRIYSQISNYAGKAGKAGTAGKACHGQTRITVL
jgi:hypothetical protein